MKTRIIIITSFLIFLFNDTVKAQQSFEPDAYGNLIIPEGVTSIGGYKNNQNIVTITFPSTLTTINEGAFSDCYYLTTINVPASVEYIAYNAFSGCSRLKYIEVENFETYSKIKTGFDDRAPSLLSGRYLYKNGSIEDNLIFPYGMKIIPNLLCFGLQGIKTITLPSTITMIETQSLYFQMWHDGDNPPVTMYCYAETPPYVDIPWGFDKESLHVPVGTKELYKNASGWNEFDIIIDDLIGTGEFIEPTELTISESKIKLEEGTTYQLSANVLPVHTTYNIEWSSDNTDVATVSNSGLVTAVKEGSTTITVSCGELSQSCRVDVGDYEIFFNPTSKTISKGEKSYVGVQVLPNDYFPNEPIRVSSSDPSILQVENTIIMNGYGDIYFTGLEVGKANIIVSYGEKEATCEITVSPVLAEKVVVSPELVELKVGETYQLSAFVSPENTTDKTITWVSENPEIVSVSETGLITCKKWGNTSVKAYCGDVWGYCVVHVLQPEIETLLIQPNKVAFEQGETVKLDLIISPDNVPEYSVSVSSSNTSIVTVNKTEIKTGETSFEITGVSVGNATITAKYGQITASCEVTVNPVLAEKIVIEPEMAELKIGETYQLSAKVYPDNATNKTIEWSSSNQSIVSVNGEGLITAISEGSAVITAKCGDMSATSNITVVKSIIEAEQIILNVERAELNIGETLQLETTVLPADATDKTVIWASSDTDVASVSQSGLVTALKSGNVEITVSCGDISATCLITVTDDAGIYSLLANPESKISVYSTDGFLIRKDCKIEDLKTLTKGIYIIVSGKEKYKIYL